MRIRSIKPEFWRSTDISALDIEDRLLFIGLWSYVDDNGVGVDKLATITADLFADDIIAAPPETFARVSRGLARLTEGGSIIRYTVEGDDFLEVVNWSKHQRIDKPGKARYPRHDAENAVIREGVARLPVTLAPGTGEQGNRGTGEQGNRGTDSHSAAPSVTDLEPALDLKPIFEQCWKAWPKKVEKKKSYEAFVKAAKKIDPHELSAAITQFGIAYGATTETKYVPALVYWLNGERWTDSPPAASTPQSSGHERAYARQAQNLAVIERAIELDGGNKDTIWELEQQ